MVSRLPVFDADGEVGDLSKVDPTLFKPFSALPVSLQTKLRGIQRGRPKAAVTKESVKIRLVSKQAPHSRANPAKPEPPPDSPPHGLPCARNRPKL